MSNDLVVLTSTVSASITEPPIGLGCSTCTFRNFCGGISHAYDCMQFCCRKPSRCELACPNSPRFSELVTDAGGWDPKGIVVNQRSLDSLPLYIPMIQHGSSRVRLIIESIVAVPLSVAVAFLRGQAEPTALRFRADLRLHAETRIILIGVAEDPFLELFWRDMVIEDFPTKLANLEIDHITAPNFSAALNLPRTEALTNRSRILNACHLLSEAGLSVIPHLNASRPIDWEFWTAFLIERPDIHFVAKEFQTGLRNQEVARWHIRQLEKLQLDLGRRLGLIAIGGKGAIEELHTFRQLTIIDSTPFMKAVNRQVWTPETRTWNLSETIEGASVDEHLRANIRFQREDVQLRRMKSLQMKLPIDMPLSRILPALAVAREGQGLLFPEMHARRVA